MVYEHTFTGQTARLTLRAFEEKDAVDFSAYRSDPAIALIKAGRRPTRWNRRKHSSPRCAPAGPASPDNGIKLRWKLKDSGQLIGDCAFHLSEDSRQAEIGMTLARPFQSLGFAAEAGAWLLEYLFGRLELHRVYANIDPRNRPAIRSVEKMGLRHEGRFIQSLWLKDEWVTRIGTLCCGMNGW